MNKNETILNHVLKYAATCYEFKIENAVPMISGSNAIYKVERQGLNFYLRISQKSAAYLMGEMDWLIYLKDAIHAPVPIMSRNSNLIESYQSGKEIYQLCLFSELIGMPWNKNDLKKWNSKTFYKWGAAMGKLHALTKQYTPSSPTTKRPNFEDDHYLPENFNFLSTISQILEKINKEILALPKDLDAFGLIHCDMHPHNLLFTEDDIVVLDFDDCTYAWFALDIGIALYHALWWGIPDRIIDQNAYAKDLIKHFLNGYLSANQLSAFWLKKIPLFMRWRQIGALGWFTKTDNLDDIIYNDWLKIDFDIRKHISLIEQGKFYEGCKINEDDFLVWASCE